MSEKQAEQPRTTAEELAAITRQRAQTYRFIARLYRTEVDKEFLDQLCSMRFPYKTGNDALDSGYYAISKYLSGSRADVITELAVDYARTFIGHRMDGLAAAFPYESVYTSEKHLLMQEARDEVLAIYRSEGIEKAPDWHEGEDHIALECEFMATLCERAASSLEQEDESAALASFKTQQGFLRGHLHAWAPRFTADVRRFAKCGLYLGLADITDGFLKADAELLEELLGAE